MLQEQRPTAQPAAIRSHIEYLTERWGELGQDCLFEVRFLSSEDSATVKDVSRYAPTFEGIEQAISHILAMNAHGMNAYIMVNPIMADAQITAGKGAKDEHIAASFFHWADADDEQAANNIRAFAGPRPTMVVLTGKTPCPRPHVYWRLEEPTRNLEAWSATQKSIAATLRTDPSVINPSRIMRLAGTVNWPKPKKQAKGYIPELTELHIHSPDDRPDVTSERMARVFPPKTADGANGADDASWLHRDDGKTASDFADMLYRARTDGQKHTGVRDLAASLAGQGVNRSLTEAIIREACPVWDENVESLINSAYSKFYSHQAIAQFQTGELKTELEWPTPLTDFDEANLPRREWIYGNDYIRKYVSVVASAGGIGKTSQAIVEALSIVTNRELLGTKVKESCNAWIVNLEDPESELRMRTLAAMKHYHILPEQVRGKLFLDGEDTIQITLAMETREGVVLNDALVEKMKQRIIEKNIGVVIIDPFVSTHMVNENSNASIQAVVALLRTLARETGASICLLHHIRKGNGEDASVDSVRGAGSLIGAARAVRVINRLNGRDAASLGIPDLEARSIFRVDDGKANLAPPAERAVYRRMIGVELDNGEWVGVTVEYELPDEWAGMTTDVVNAMLDMIAAGPPREDDSEEYYSAHMQSKDRWVGSVITGYTFAKAEHNKSDVQAKQIIKTWLETGLLEEIEYFSRERRKDRKGVTATGRVGVE